MKNILIKVSGDLCYSKKFINFVKEIFKNNHISILVGGGKQINETLKKASYKLSKHPTKLGRELKSFKEKIIATECLYNNCHKLRKKLNLPINIKPSILNWHKQIHVNGDIFVLTLYHGFDKIYIVTTKNRIEIKQKEFKEYKKIKVISL